MTLQRTFEEVNDVARELVQKVQKVSKQQKSLWQQVPYLALQADGRTGYSDQYSRAYHQGYWAVESSVRDGSYSVYVDLETGELVNAYDPRETALDEDVLSIILHLHKLDATQIVSALKAHATEPIGNYYNAKDKRERTEYINSILQQGNITQVSYRRTVRPKEVHEANVLAPILDTLG